MKYIMSIILLLIFTLGCDNTPKVENNNVKVKDTIVFNCLIFPSGVPSETYSIQLHSEGNMTVKFGEKAIGTKGFTKVYKSEIKTLDKSDYNRLLKLQEGINGMKEVKRGQLKKGGWEIIIESNNNIYHFYYGDLKGSFLHEIINAIKEVSPIEIDIHGWS